MRRNAQNPAQIEYILDAASEAANFRASLNETTGAACFGFDLVCFVCSKGAARFVFSFLHFNLFHSEEGNFPC